MESLQNFTVVARPVSDRDGTIYYIGQCVEYDIAVQGSTLQELKDRIFKAIFSHILISIEHDEEPFINLRKGTVEDPTVKNIETTMRFPLEKSLSFSTGEYKDRLPSGELSLAVI